MKRKYEGRYILGNSCPRFMPKDAMMGITAKHFGVLPEASLRTRRREGVYLSMGSSQVITLFSEPARSNPFPSPFVISILLHASCFGLFTAKLIQNHRIIERFPTGRFAVRELDFHSREPQARQAASGGVAYPGPIPGPIPGLGLNTNKPTSGGSSAGSPLVTQQTAKLMPAPQT